MSQDSSYFEIVCECGKKLQTCGDRVTCHHCGRELRIESWQAKHTQTADGRVIETAALDKQKKGAGK